MTVKKEIIGLSNVLI